MYAPPDALGFCKNPLGETNPCIKYAANGKAKSTPNPTLALAAWSHLILILASAAKADFSMCYMLAVADSFLLATELISSIVIQEIIY